MIGQKINLVEKMEETYKLEWSKIRAVKTANKLREAMGASRTGERKVTKSFFSS